MEALRLLKSYRGYRPGKVIQATPSLADHLVEAGIAARDHQASLLPAEPRPQAERAVAAVPVETR